MGFCLLHSVLFFLQKDTAGQVVIDRVCDKLNLVEKDYFGLRYVDADKQRASIDHDHAEMQFVPASDRSSAMTVS